ncbi:MAG: FAD-binding oxidoreductase [Actinomycetota bacterium]
MSDSHVRNATTTALWLDRLPQQPHRDPVTGNTNCDVAIVGGGFSGLWTAWYLRRLDPTLRIQIIEKHFCGYGASGRNGGWAVGEIAGSMASYAKRSSHDEALRQVRALFDAVDEIGRETDAAGIDCDYQKGGCIRLARNGPQAKRQRDEVEHEHSHGLTEADLRLLTPDEARSHLNATDVQSGIFFEHCAALDPAKLVVGLAERLEADGVAIAEGTAVSAIVTRPPGATGPAGANKVVTEHGTVTADVVIRATEAYTRDIADSKLDLLPIYSLMIATEPLPADVMAEIGLADRPTFADDRFMVIYGQRTADDRLAFGGRGVPYLFGSRIAESAELHEPSHELIRSTLVEMLPILGDMGDLGVEITHRWGGVLGIPRNWVPGLRFDRREGFGVLGGYVGEGVAAANLAGRTMAELIAGEQTPRTSLPWVGVRARRWEPEPFRWLGVRGSRAVLTRADDYEYASDKPASWQYRLSRLLRGG